MQIACVDNRMVVEYLFSLLKLHYSPYLCNSEAAISLGKEGRKEDGILNNLCRDVLRSLDGSLSLK